MDYHGYEEIPEGKREFLGFTEIGFHLLNFLMSPAKRMSSVKQHSWNVIWEEVVFSHQVQHDD